MADRFRWGILSTGHIAAQFVRDLAHLPGAGAVAVGSRDGERAAAFAHTHGIERSHASWQDLADDPEIDAIYVATPHHAHFEATMVCLRAGKPTLTEKPFTLDAASSEMLVAEAASAGVFLMEAMWMRCIPAIRRIAGTIADGAIGDVVDVRADFGVSGPFAPTHRMRAKELGGGALLDLGVYPVTFAQLFLGVPQTVRAWARIGPEGTDENTGLVLGYASGAVATLTCSMLGETPRSAAITGTEGRIDVPREFFHPQQFTVWRGDEAERVAVPFDGLGYHFEAAEVQRCVREGLLESPLIPHAETLAVMRTLDEARDQIGVTYD
jgi:predicted dehydrogenase